MLHRAQPGDEQITWGRAVTSLAITPELQKKRSTVLNRMRWAVSFFLVTSLDYGVTRRLNLDLTGD